MLAAQNSSIAIPRFTWVTCECGCGYEGEDEVAQYLIEEALDLRARLEMRPKPGEQAVAGSLARRERALQVAG